MARYWYNCEDCGKRIKKKPTFEGIPLCKDCTRNRRKRECVFCNKEFIPRRASGDRYENQSKFCSQSCASKHNLTGRTLSKSHKENLSKSACNNRGGFKNVKFYKVFCPFLNKNISVQGTWELKYANMLNKQNIEWVRNKSINLSYIRETDNIIRTYYPDFYLINENIYIEIKGYYSDENKEKMKLVKNQNKNANILMLMKDDLIKLGVLV